MEKLKPKACLIRSVRDRANKWALSFPPVGAAIARDPALRKLVFSGAWDVGLLGVLGNREEGVLRNEGA